jgi:hypothetical protein
MQRKAPVGYPMTLYAVYVAGLLHRMPYLSLLYISTPSRRRLRRFRYLRLPYQLSEMGRWHPVGAGGQEGRAPLKREICLSSFTNIRQHFNL